MGINVEEFINNWMKSQEGIYKTPECRVIESRIDVKYDDLGPWELFKSGKMFEVGEFVDLGRLQRYEKPKLRQINKETCVDSMDAFVLNCVKRGDFEYRGKDISECMELNK